MIFAAFSSGWLVIWNKERFNKSPHWEIEELVENDIKAEPREGALERTHVYNETIKEEYKQENKGEPINSTNQDAIYDIWPINALECITYFVPLLYQLYIYCLVYTNMKNKKLFHFSHICQMIFTKNYDVCFLQL